MIGFTATRGCKAMSRILPTLEEAEKQESKFWGRKWVILVCVGSVCLVSLLDWIGPYRRVEGPILLIILAFVLDHHSNRIQGQRDRIEGKLDIILERLNVQ
jgi:hypothetical protein